MLPQLLQLLIVPYKTGALTSNLSENPQKVNGLAGITLGT
jgi:hypothetical protein